MDKFIKQLSKDYPGVIFRASSSFCWSPKGQEILYVPSGRGEQKIWSVLHELGHALLKHTMYESDIELVQLEVSAWALAEKISGNYNLKIDHEHVQNCLDTYRDWLHRRSSCPVCGNVSLQSSVNQYQCFNCATSWKVSNSRFCRPYRQRDSSNKKSPAKSQQAIFI
ncbi:MAG TPA: hypothetical protein VMR18_03040 [Candidatus Saccharimonadales bacterium]|jgi:hypothetical protein|nr:hypothetical protein [Candidatus Saccharimonadales bacterium]